MDGTDVSSGCHAYEGWEAVAKLAQSHVVMFGEMHGTNESPGAIGSLLCELVAADIPVRFGIEAEWPQSAALDGALRYPLDPEAVYAAAPAMWDSHDGRSSEAVYRLLEGIALWRSFGADISVFAFDHDPALPADQALTRSAVMAREVDRNMAGFDGAVLLFAGGYHVVLNPPGSGRTGGSLASEVTARPVIALNMAYGPGEAYVTASLGDGDLVTGPLKLSATHKGDTRVRAFDLTPTGYHSGIYLTGPITASPPAFDER